MRRKDIKKEMRYMNITVNNWKYLPHLVVDQVEGRENKKMKREIINVICDVIKKYRDKEKK